jgi:serine/threonine protein kinase
MNGKKFFHNWKTRYFLLVDGGLAYYKSEGDAQPVGYATMSAKSKCILENKYGEGGLVLRGVQKDLHMLAENEAEARAWQEAITKQIGLASKRRSSIVANCSVFANAVPEEEEGESDEEEELQQLEQPKEEARADEAYNPQSFEPELCSGLIEIGDGGTTAAGGINVANYAFCAPAMSDKSGSYSVEFKVLSVVNDSVAIAVGGPSSALEPSDVLATRLGFDSGGNRFRDFDSKRDESGEGLPAWGRGDVVKFVYDSDMQQCSLWHNGTCVSDAFEWGDKYKAMDLRFQFYLNSTSSVTLQASSLTVEAEQAEEKKKRAAQRAARVHTRQEKLKKGKTRPKKEGSGRNAGGTVGKQGYLKKHTGGKVVGKSWKRRYFRLIQGGLAYYKGSEKTHAKGFIRVGAETTIAEGGKSSDPPHTFRVTNLYREYRLVAESNVDRTAWVQAIQQLVETEKAIAGVVIADGSEGGEANDHGDGAEAADESAAAVAARKRELVMAKAGVKMKPPAHSQKGNDDNYGIEGVVEVDFDDDVDTDDDDDDGEKGGEEKWVLESEAESKRIEQINVFKEGEYVEMAGKTGSDGNVLTAVVTKVERAPDAEVFDGSEREYDLVYDDGNTETGVKPWQLAQSRRRKSLEMRDMDDIPQQVLDDAAGVGAAAAADGADGADGAAEELEEQEGGGEKQEESARQGAVVGESGEGGQKQEEGAGGPSSETVGQAAAADLSAVGLDDLEIISTIGSGSYGVVKLVACKERPNETLALKVLNKSFITRMKQQKQVMREARVYKELNHPTVAKLHTTFQDEERLYMLMEFCAGGELFTLLYEEQSPFTHGEDGMAEDVVRFYVANVVLALEYLHSVDTVYRDLKMENLVLDYRGYPKLVDMGFAKVIRPGEHSYTKCGSPDYMAPELHLGKAHGKGVDVWALGVILFEMLTGSTPFFDEDPQKIVRKSIRVLIDWPHEFRKNHEAAAKLIAKLLVRDEAKRLGMDSRGLSDFAAIKSHNFFEGLDWAKLAERTVEPPLVPDLEDPRDCSMFQEFSDSEDDEADEADDGTAAVGSGSGWCDGF